MAQSVLHEGIVRAGDGAPVPDALVAVARGTEPTPEIAIRSNHEGRFGIALPPGSYEIEARAPGGAHGLVTVRTGEARQVIEIVLDGTP